MVEIENMTGMIDESLLQILPDEDRHRTVNILQSMYGNESVLDIRYASLRDIDTSICTMCDKMHSLVHRLILIYQQIESVFSQAVPNGDTQTMKPVSDRLLSIHTRYSQEAALRSGEKERDGSRLVGGGKEILEMGDGRRVDEEGEGELLKRLSYVDRCVYRSVMKNVRECVT